MYADYTYYCTEFYGRSIDEWDWPYAAQRASDFIDYITWNKAKNNAELEAVKKACCAVAEQYATIDAMRAAANAKVTSEGIIASESVGEHSRSFRSGADGIQAITAAEAQLSAIARQYLLPTGLLYRGGVVCVHSAHSNAV